MVQPVQKKILIGYCITVVLAVLYVPWTSTVTIPGLFGSRGMPFTQREYSFIFSNPFALGGGVIDFQTVILELVAITAIAGVLYLFSVLGKGSKS